MEKRHKKTGFFFKLFMVLAIIAALVSGVYFALDKLIVPKYFKAYGIENMHDLVGMVKTLYNSPNEKDMITNGYLPSDLKTATDKLKHANFPMTESGVIDYMTISEGVDRDQIVQGEYEFTDREIAAIVDQMLASESGILASKLPNIEYIDVLNINILELIITPNIVEYDGNAEPIYDTNSANVSFTCKVDTSSVRNQMASHMDTPLFLLNMIVPKTLYIQVDYNMQKDIEGEWHSEKGNIGINGRTAEDSEILLNLLIEFIFPVEDEMTIDKLCETFGNIIIQGIEIFGEVDIKANINETGQSGVVLRT